MMSTTWTERVPLQLQCGEIMSYILTAFFRLLQLQCGGMPGYGGAARHDASDSGAFAEASEGRGEASAARGSGSIDEGDHVERNVENFFVRVGEPARGGGVVGERAVRVRDAQQAVRITDADRAYFAEQEAESLILDRILRYPRKLLLESHHFWPTMFTGNPRVFRRLVAAVGRS